MKKWIIPIITLIILVGGVAAGIYLVRQDTEFREKAAPATTLTFNTPDTSVEVGDTFVVSSQINSGENQISGVQLAINYNPDILNVLSVTKGNYLGENANSTNPTILADLGLIDYALFLPFSSTPVQGSGTVAIITFEALSAGSTPISYVNQQSYQLDGQSKLAQTQAYGVDESANVIASTTPITIEVLGAQQTQPTATPTPQETGGGNEPTATPTQAAPTNTPTPSPTPTDDAGIGGTNLPTSTPTPTQTAVNTPTPTPARLAQNNTTPTPTPAELLDSGVEDYTFLFLILGGVSIIASGAFLLTSKS